MHIKIPAYMAVLTTLSLTACSTTKDVTSEQPNHFSKGQVIVLRQACLFIDNPGVDQLIPAQGQELPLQDRATSKDLIPAETRVRYLGTFAESGYMVDTHIRAYGRILDGPFRGRRVGLDSVMSVRNHDQPIIEPVTNQINAH